jgi:hypothetical protein
MATNYTLVYLDYATSGGAVREFGIYDPEYKAVYQLTCRATNINGIARSGNWAVLPTKWEKTYLKWAETNSKSKNRIYGREIKKLREQAEKLIQTRRAQLQAAE